MDYIPLEECLHGHTYAIRSRNLTFGVFDASVEGFVGVRTKFGSRYLFTEYHYDTGAPFGTARPLVVVEPCPVADLREYLGSRCSLHGEWVERRSGQSEYRVGRFGDVKFTDYHSESGSKVEDGLDEVLVDGADVDRVHLVSNAVLFDYLDAVPERVDWDTCVAAETG